MVSNPRPTRAEMTDVANAVLDGVHCVMLSAETAIGAFPVESVSTVAAIARNAEAATNYSILHNFIRDVTAKPFSTGEAVAAAAAESSLDRAVQMVVVVSETGKIANLLSKFKASVPILLLTTDPKIAAAAKIMFAMYPCLVEFLGDRRDLPSLIGHAVKFARDTGVYTGGSVAVLHGANEPDTEIEPVMQLWSDRVLTRMMP
jgi:pyruvate kinase